MSVISATDAKNRFGQLLEMAQAEPVYVQKDGRDVVVVISAEDYKGFAEYKARPKVRPVIEELLQESVARRRSLYEALAK